MAQVGNYGGWLGNTGVRKGGSTNKGGQILSGIIRRAGQMILT